MEINRSTASILLVITLVLLFQIIPVMGMAQTSSIGSEEHSNRPDSNPASDSNQRQISSHTPLPRPLENNGNNPTGAKKSLMKSFISVVGSLLLVLGIFIGIMCLLKKFVPQDNTVLSSDLIECVGHYPFTPKIQLHLILFGERLLLVVPTSNGLELLSEISDPEILKRYVQRDIKSFQKLSSPLIHDIINQYKTQVQKKGESV